MNDEDTNLNETIENDAKNRDKGPVRRKVEKEAKKHLKKATKKAKKKMKSTLFKQVGLKSLFGFFPILTILFMTIGIISFITTMPGLVQENILKKLIEFGQGISYKLNGPDYYLNVLAKDEGEESQKNILMYLDDMGIDPVGYGFAAFYRRGKDADGNDTVTYETNIDIEDIKEFKGLFGAIEYNNEETKKRLREDLLLKYIISNERTYLVHDLGSIGNGVLSGLTEWLGKLNLKGMIETEIEGFNDSTISIDREKKQMIISSKNLQGIFRLAIQDARYNLESWAGRYGMPLEFLLTLHIATMTSDITDEMLTNPALQTTMYVDSTKGTYDVSYYAKYKGQKLPIERGANKDTSELEWNNDWVEINDDEVKYNMTEDEWKKIAESATLKKLYLWIQKMRSMQVREEVDSNFIDRQAYKAKQALLGEEAFRVLYIIPDGYTVDTDGSWKNNCYMGSNQIPERFDTDGTFTISISQEGKKPNVYQDGNDYHYYEKDNQSTRLSTGVINGLQYYIDNEAHAQELIDNEYIRDGILCILMQLDSFLYKTSSEEEKKAYTTYKTWLENDYFSPGGLNGIDFPLGDKIYRIDRAGKNEDLKGTSLNSILGAEWMRFWNENKNPSTQQAQEELRKIMDMINKLYEKRDHREEIIQEVITQVFKRRGLDVEIKPDELMSIYEALISNSDDFEFVFPKIKSVMKHWYKDVVFDAWTPLGSGKHYSVYQEENTLTFPVILEEENPDLEVTAVLTHNKGGAPSKQVSEPWVVKGDIVTVDGKVVAESVANDILSIADYGDDDDAPTYHIGDGYRATKKIFTQGQYYVFDGSHETAKSIWYAKRLEELDGKNKKYAKVYVQNGRIILSWVYDGIPTDSTFTDYYDQDTNSWNVPAQKIEETRKTEEKCQAKNAVQTAEDGSWSTFLAMASISGETEMPVELYLIAITENEDMAYVSAADDVGKSKKSVERINSMLKSMGVITVRQPVSFDNTTETGDVTTLTAFGILEGMHTESAELIYRDLKEFLIELGYYTKAEFELIETNVLKWFIPDYLPATNEERVHWNQAKDEDRLKYGAILYPTEIDNNGKVIHQGFEADLSVIAPGNCRVIDIGDTSITIEFDGISQPEIGALDKYTMIINGIDVTEDQVKVLLSDGSTTTKTLADVKRDKDVILEGEKIGVTGTEPIQVILKSRIGGYVNNIEDYMAPETAGKGTYSPQEYQFTEDEKLLLAYVIQKEAAPEGLVPYMNTNNSVYDTAEEQAMAYAEAVGYVLINRALRNYMNLGNTIEKQSSDPTQYSSGYTIEKAKEADKAGGISAGSKKAAEFCAKYGCSAVVNPNGVEMSDDVIGESAWIFGKKVFWWIDMNKNGKQDIYATEKSKATKENPYPVEKGENPGNDPKLQEWPWDVYLTYSE